MKWYIGIILTLIICIVTGTLDAVFHNTNELVSSLASVIQAICIVIQSYLIYKQFKLSEKIDNKNKEEYKGIFLLDRTNINSSNEIFNNKYDLTREVSFHNRGNDHVIVKAITINGKIIGIGYNTFFTNLEEYSKLLIDLELTSEDLEKDNLKFEIKISLENLKGYEYDETIEISFEKDKEENVYNLNYFNVNLS